MRIVPTLYFLLFLCSIFACGCIDVKPVKVGDIEGIKINEMTKTSVTLELMIPIENPNNFKFKITDVDLDISLNGTKLGKVREIKKITVPANSSEVHSFCVEVEFSKILAGSLDLLSTLMKKKADLDLKGTIKAKAFMISKKIDINVSKPVDLLKKFK